MFVAHLLPQHVAEDGRALAVEVGFERMPDGLVQQDARTAGTHYDRHFASLRLDSLEEQRSLFHGFARQHVDNVVGQELKALAIGAGSHIVLHPSLVLHDADGYKVHHRAIVVIAGAFGVAEEHMRGAVRQDGLHLHYPLVQREDFFVQLLQIRDFLLHADILQRLYNGISALGQCLFRQSGHAGRLARRSDAGSRAGGTQHFVERNTLDIGIPRLVARQNTHAHTEVDVGTAIVHLAVHQRDTIVECMFEIKVYIVTSLFQRRLHYFLQVGFGYAEMGHGCFRSRLLAGRLQLARRHGQRRQGQCTQGRLPVRRNSLLSIFLMILEYIVHVLSNQCNFRLPFVGQQPLQLFGI